MVMQCEFIRERRRDEEWRAKLWMTLPLMWLPCRVCDRVAGPGENRVFSMTLR